MKLLQHLLYFKNHQMILMLTKTLGLHLNQLMNQLPFAPVLQPSLPTSSQIPAVNKGESVNPEGEEMGTRDLRSTCRTFY
eukprot:10940447-Ditylum_brightwellii.AAC.1